MAILAMFAWYYYNKDLNKKQSNLEAAMNVMNYTTYATKRTTKSIHTHVLGCLRTNTCMSLLFYQRVKRAASSTDETGNKFKEVQPDMGREIIKVKQWKWSLV